MIISYPSVFPIDSRDIVTIGFRFFFFYSHQLVAKRRDSVLEYRMIVLRDIANTSGNNRSSR